MGNGEGLFSSTTPTQYKRKTTFPPFTHAPQVTRYLLLLISYRPYAFAKK